MVFTRLNVKEPNPNPQINFITALSNPDPKSQEEARQLLRALAAQVRPIMKKHGFMVNTLEELQFNEDFAGLNWEYGDTIRMCPFPISNSTVTKMLTLEIVLRRPDGEFLPLFWLMSTLCHELAHNKYMDHGPSFQKLWSRLQAEVSQLQAAGYYGDGFWSEGTCLRNLPKVESGEGAVDGQFPAYVCGGARMRSQPSATSRDPSGTWQELISYLQTEAQTKAGESATATSSACGGDQASRKGIGLEISATSEHAREQRALAAERRLLALQGKSTGNQPKFESLGDANNVVEVIQETDANQLQTLPNSDQGRDEMNVNDRCDPLPNKRSLNDEPTDEGESSKTSASDQDNIEMLSCNEEAGQPSNVSIPSRSANTLDNVISPNLSREGEEKGPQDDIPSSEKETERETEEGVVDKTKEGMEDEEPEGKKRKRPETEKQGSGALKEGGKGAKRAKPENDTEKPATKERKAKTIAKAKIQASKKTATTKKRGVGRPKKSSSSVKKDDETLDDVEVQADKLS